MCLQLLHAKQSTDVVKREKKLYVMVLVVVLAANA